MLIYEYKSVYTDLKVPASPDKRKWTDDDDNQNEQDRPSRNIGGMLYPAHPRLCGEQNIYSGEILVRSGKLRIHWNRKVFPSINSQKTPPIK